ncbi:hypothetical protein [Neisseria lactamica]|nr:hypothetical protein [Neisseria lactamica]
MIAQYGQEAVRESGRRFAMPSESPGCFRRHFDCRVSVRPLVPVFVFV